MKHAFLLLLALVVPAFCLSRTSAQAPVSPPLTGKIAHITILGTKNILLDTVRAVLTLHPGDAYTPEATAKDVTAIKGIGFFSVVTDKEIADPAGGVNVVYTVSENPVIQTIKFTTNAADGKPPFPFSELIAQMNTQPGQILNANILLKDLNNLFNRQTGYVVKQGHLLYVSGNPNIDPKTGILIIPLAEYYIQSIQVTGNSRVRTEDILAQMHTKVGDLFDRDALVADMGAVYATGKFRAANFTVTSIGPGKLAITVPVVEQPAATGSLDEKQGEIIPFDYDPITSPYPVVQVSVNGKPPLPFVVDTGTNAALSLNPWAAKQLGLTSNAPVEKAKGGFSFSRVPLQSVVLQGDGKPSDSNAAFGIKEAFIIDLNAISKVVLGQHIAGIIMVP